MDDDCDGRSPDLRRHVVRPGFGPRVGVWIEIHRVGRDAVPVPYGDGDRARPVRDMNHRHVSVLGSQAFASHDEKKRKPDNESHESSWMGAGFVMNAIKTTACQRLFFVWSVFIGLSAPVHESVYKAKQTKDRNECASDAIYGMERFSRETSFKCLCAGTEQKPPGC